MIKLKLNIGTILLTPLRPVLRAKRQTEEELEKRLNDDIYLKILPLEGRGTEKNI